MTVGFGPWLRAATLIPSANQTYDIHNTNPDMQISQLFAMRDAAETAAAWWAEQADKADECDRQRCLLGAQKAWAEYDYAHNTLIQLGAL